NSWLLASQPGRECRTRGKERRAPSREGGSMAEESILSAIRQSLVRRWLEILLPAYTLAFLAVMLYPEQMPRLLGIRPNESLVPWVVWALVGAMTGILLLWRLIILFFLLYSPFYLLGRIPMLVGRGAWVDRREVHFYLACFVLLMVLGGLLVWDPRKAFVAFTAVAGCGPVFWRYVV